MNRMLTAAAIALAAAAPAFAADDVAVTRTTPAEVLFNPADVERFGSNTGLSVTFGETDTARATETFSPSERALLGLGAESAVSVTRFNGAATAPAVGPFVPAPGQS